MIPSDIQTLMADGSAVSCTGIINPSLNVECGNRSGIYWVSSRYCPGLMWGSEVILVLDGGWDWGEYHVYRPVIKGV
jgi:hypothetical protein